MKDPLVDAEWLALSANDPKLIVLDCSIEDSINDSVNSYQGQRIKGARFFDIEKDFSDLSSDLPHTLPSEKDFEKAAQKLGINQDSILVCYDNMGIYSSPRAWWMFLAMGHTEVYVLNGGLSAWVEAGNETEKIQKEVYPKGNFQAKFSTALIRDAKDVLDNIDTEAEVLIDARSSGRFEGSADEPRPGVSSGHIPKSKNLPFPELIENGFLKDKNEVLKMFKRLGIDNKGLIFSCGSGLTSCILMLASTHVQENYTSVYDGSWTQWATIPELPIIKGK